MSKVRKYSPINSDLLTRVTVTVSTNAVNLLHKYSAELQQPNSWLLYRLACIHNTKVYTSTSTKKISLMVNKNLLTTNVAQITSARAIIEYSVLFLSELSPEAIKLINSTPLTESELSAETLLTLYRDIIQLNELNKVFGKGAKILEDLKYTNAKPNQSKKYPQKSCKISSDLIAKGHAILKQAKASDDVDKGVLNSNILAIAKQSLSDSGINDIVTSEPRNSSGAHASVYAKDIDSVIPRGGLGDVLSALAVIVSTNSQYKDELQKLVCNFDELAKVKAGVD